MCFLPRSSFRCRDACKSKRGLASSRKMGGSSGRPLDCTELRAVQQRIQRALGLCTAGPDAEALVAFLERRARAASSEEEAIPESPTGAGFSDSLLGASWRSEASQAFLAAFIEAEKEARRRIPNPLLFQKLLLRCEPPHPHLASSMPLFRPVVSLGRSLMRC